MANVVTHLSGKDVDEHAETVHRQHEGYCDKCGNLSARMMEVTIQQWFMSVFMSIVMNVTTHFCHWKIVLYRSMYSCYVQRHMRILFHEYSWN